jgi:uncharacterized DUF497 family protein
MGVSEWADYEWDERKRLTNLDKHGIDFQDVTLLTANPMMIAKARTVSDEDRWMATGQMKGIIVTMIFTKREKTIRIISLRSARHGERKAYQTLLSR